jgi:hypothetical protein
VAGWPNTARVTVAGAIVLVARCSRSVTLKSFGSDSLNTVFHAEPTCRGSEPVV